MKYHALLASILATTGTTAIAATFAPGYTYGNATSQLLTANGGSGAITFVDNAATGGGDGRFDSGNPNFGWLVDGSAIWNSGDTVSLTGLAVPLWANNPTSDNTNNTQNGTFTFSFYTAGADNAWNGTDNLGTSDDSLIATVDLTFASAEAGVDEYYVNFDSSLNWTANSDTIVVSMASTGALRLKLGPASPTTPRAVLTTGATDSDGTFSLAGSVTPVPEPSVALLGLFSCLFVLRRSR